MSGKRIPAKNAVYMYFIHDLNLTTLEEARS